MKLTCSQMDVLISFYIEGDLSNSLKKQVEEHIKSCTTCRAKYDIIKGLISDLKNSVTSDTNSQKQATNSSKATSEQYRIFKNNLSAYIDNELTDEENIKIKKFTINNLNARADLENSYNIRKIMNNSFKKTRNEIKNDYSKSIIRQLELEDEAITGIHPSIKLLISFMISVLIITSLVLTSFN